MQYNSLLNEMKNIPDNTFTEELILKLARIIDYRDLSEDNFINIIDPTHQENVSLPEFKNSMFNLKSDNFSLTDEEVERFFRSQTKATSSLNITLKVSELKKKVFNSVKALLLDKINTAISSNRNKFEINLKSYAGESQMIEYSQFD